MFGHGFGLRDGGGCFVLGCETKAGCVSTVNFPFFPLLFCFGRLEVFSD